MSKIFETNKYDKFCCSENNRDVTKHPNLVRSMKAHGFINCPIIVSPANEKGVHEIFDGQHRFEAAKSLGIPIKYVIQSDLEKVSITDVNNAQKRWTIADYVSSFISKGNKDYIELQAFSDRYGIGIHTSALLLSDLSGNHVSVRIKTGKFVVKSRETAKLVGEFVASASAFIKFARQTMFTQALIRCFMVKRFDPNRLLHVIQKSPQDFKPQANLDQMLEQFERAYNHSHRNPIPLKFEAENAWRARVEKNLGIVKE